MEQDKEARKKKDKDSVDSLTEQSPVSPSDEDKGIPGSVHTAGPKNHPGDAGGGMQGG